MFGHDDKKDDDTKDAETAPEIAPDQPDGGAVATATDQPADNQDTTVAADNPSTDPAPTDEVTAVGGVADDNDAWQHPGEPIDDGPEQISDIIGPAGGNPANGTHKSTPSFQVPAPTLSLPAADHDEDANANVPHELIDIKQKALHELSPLMGQLDLEPEDKFRTLMMMIQASDDQKLLKEAYDVAHKIKDEKVRAQALLDIVNEINYFTQHPAD